MGFGNCIFQQRFQQHTGMGFGNCIFSAALSAAHGNGLWQLHFFSSAFSSTQDGISFGALATAFFQQRTGQYQLLACKQQDNHLVCIRANLCMYKHDN